MKVGTWNVAWRKPESPAGSVMRDQLLKSGSEVLCITEAHAAFMGPDGHTISASPDYGYPLIADRRKVLLWSRSPWEEIDTVGEETMPGGRFVAGRTVTSGSPMLFIGVCIPWAAAHVSTGRRDRKRWDDHISYLKGLGEYLERTGESFVIMGDFNQAIPRRRAPVRVFDALEKAVLRKARIFTQGGFERHGFPIDHIGASPDINCMDVRALSAFDEKGTRLSDHFGLLAGLEMPSS